LLAILSEAIGEFSTSNGEAERLVIVVNQLRLSEFCSNSA